VDKQEVFRFSTADYAFIEKHYLNFRKQYLLKIAGRFPELVSDFEDVLHDAIIHLVRYRRTKDAKLSDEECLKILNTIIWRICCKKYKKCCAMQKMCDNLMNTEIRASCDMPDAVNGEQQARSLLAKCMKTLNSKERTIIDYHYFKRMDANAVVAAGLLPSVGACYTEKCRCMKKMQAYALTNGLREEWEGIAEYL
jgi:DNA-directed RNA polymerase specialized sigma24 family protein